MKRVLIAYTSYFGNSKSSAEEFARLMESKGIQTETVSVTEGQTPSTEWDVLVLFTPVRRGSIVGKTKKFVEQPTAGGAAFALVVSHAAPKGSIFSPVRSSEALQAQLLARGMRQAADITYIRVAGVKGPKEEGYLDVLARLADTIAAAPDGPTEG